MRHVLARESHYVRALVRTEATIEIGPAGGERPRGTVLTVVLTPAGPVEVLVGLKGLVEPKKEQERIERGIKKAEKELAGLNRRLDNPSFAAKAPAEVVAEVREQKAALEEKLARLAEAQVLAGEL
jgi:valyl-tRNA synthetase